MKSVKTVAKINKVLNSEKKRTEYHNWVNAYNCYMYKNFDTVFSQDELYTCYADYSWYEHTVKILYNASKSETYESIVTYVSESDRVKETQNIVIKYDKLNPSNVVEIVMDESYDVCYWRLLILDFIILGYIVALFIIKYAGHNFI